MSLEGKTCVVTGGGQGLGYACATALARDGGRVALLDVVADRAERAAERLRAEGHEALATACDVTDAASVASAVERAATELGPIRVLVNNAGIGGIERTEDHDEEVWDRVVDISLKGTFLCSRAVGKRMIADGDGGAIVNMASIMGLTFMPTRAAYASAKAAIVAFTKVTAVEWARHGIRVNALAPGYVRTEGVQAAIDDGRFEEDQIVARIPAGRMGHPEEIGEAVRYLVSPQAGYVSGHVLVIDGGYTSYGAWWPPAEGSDRPFAGAGEGS